MEQSPPPFFLRGPAPLVRLGFFALLAILLMVMDARFGYTDVLRNALTTIAYPIQRALLTPVEAAGRIGGYFQSLTDLQRENAELRAERLRAAPDLLTLDALRAENERLRALLAARDRAGVEAQFAEIIYAGRDPFARRVIIDRGIAHGVVAGQPVIDSAGVIGQVTRVHPLVSEVTLIIHKDHAIPVQVVRNGLRAVAFGSGDGATVDLRFLAANADVQPGDELVTSGIDGVYPRGLPVARVTKVERDTALSFARIVAEPLGETNQHRQLLVLALREELPPIPDAAETAERPRGKGKRARGGAR